MRCYKNFKDDRVCDVCEIIDYIKYENCKNISENKKQLTREYNLEISYIENHCQFRKTSWDEYERFWACNKRDKGYGRNADLCEPDLKCKKYCMGY